MAHSILRRAATFSVGVLMLTSGAAAAHATVHRSDHLGAVAQSVDSQIYIYDYQCDGQWTRANYNTSVGAGGISNQSGCNTNANKSAGAVITAVQACESRTALPLDCSGWNTEY